jgi:hypothetical protein
MYFRILISAITMQDSDHILLRHIQHNTTDNSPLLQAFINTVQGRSVTGNEEGNWKLGYNSLFEIRQLFDHKVTFHFSARGDVEGFLGILAVAAKVDVNDESNPRIR